MDDIIVFDRLTRDDLRQIVDIQFAHLRNRLQARRIDVALSDEAASWLAEHGFDPIYGARPLKRLMQREIADKMALRLLEGAFGEGDTLQVIVGPDGLDFDTARDTGFE